MLASHCIAGPDCQAGHEIPQECSFYLLLIEFLDRSYGPVRKTLAG